MPAKEITVKSFVQRKICSVCNITERKLRFFRDGAVLTATGLFMRAVGVAYSAFLSSRLGADGLGLWTLITSVCSFALTLASSGLGLAATRLSASAGTPERVRRALRGCFAAALVSGGISAAGLFFGAGFISERVLGDMRCALPLRLAGLGMPFAAMSGVLHGYFSAVRRSPVSAGVQIFEQLSGIGATVLLLGTSGRDIGSACASLVAGSVISDAASFLAAFVVYLALRRRDIASLCAQGDRKSAGNPKNPAREILSIVLPVSAAACLRSALSSVEHILIPRGLKKNPLTAATALASYGVLCGMALPVVMLPAAFLYSFTGLLVPEYALAEARKDERGISRISSRAISLAVFYSVGAAGFLWLFAGELGSFLYNSTDAGIFIRVLAPLVPVMYLDHTVDAMLKGLGEQFFCMKVNILDAGMSVVMVALLCGRIGIWGFVVTIWATEVVNASLSVWKLVRRASPRVSLSIAPRLILSLSAGVAVVSFMGGEGIVSFILRAVVYVMTFALVSLITLPRKTR